MSHQPPLLHSQLFLALAEQTRDIFWVADRVAGTCLYISDAFEEIWGIERQVLYDDMWAFLDYVHPDDREMFAVVHEVQEFWQGEHRIVRPDGAIRWLSSRITPLQATDGDARLVVGVSEDITERKKAQHSVRQHQGFLRALLDAMPDLLLTVRRDLTCVDVRGSRDNSWPRPPHEMLHRNLDDFVPKHVAGEARRCVEEALSSGNTTRLEYSVEAQTPQAFEARFAAIDHEETVSIIRDISERRRAEDMRQRFVENIIAAQEEERERLARELHDSVGQQLTSLLLGLRRLQDGLPQSDAQTLLSELRCRTSATIEDTQRLARGLRPRVLDDMGFAPAVECLVKEMCGALPLRVDLHMTGFNRAERMPVSVETALYRIVQEALTNVVRHARASAIDVLLERRDAWVRAVIEDNGVGFARDTAAGRRGLGVQGILERAALLRGRAAIDGSPGHGTTVSVQLPTGYADADATGGLS